MIPVVGCQVVGGTFGIVDVDIVGTIVESHVSIGCHEEACLLRRIVEGPNAVPEIVVIGMHPEGNGHAFTQVAPVERILHLGIAEPAVLVGCELMKHLSVAHAVGFQFWLLGRRQSFQRCRLLGVQLVHDRSLVEVVICQHARFVIAVGNAVLLCRHLVGMLPIVVASPFLNGQFHRRVLLHSCWVVESFIADDGRFRRCPFQVDVGKQVDAIEVGISRDAATVAHGNGLRVQLASQLVLFANLVAPCIHTGIGGSREAKRLDGGRLHLLLGEYTIIGGSAQCNLYVGGAVGERPFSLQVTSDGSVCQQLHLNRQHFLFVLVVHSIAMHEHLPLTRNLTSLVQLL